MSYGSILKEKRISTLKKSDIKGYYNYLADERGLKASTIDSIHTVLHQILDMAVDDDYLRHNPSNNARVEAVTCFQDRKTQRFNKTGAVTVS